MQYDDSLVWSCPYKQAETPKTIQFTLKADQDFFYYFWQKKKKVYTSSLQAAYTPLGLATILTLSKNFSLIYP